MLGLGFWAFKASQTHSMRQYDLSVYLKMAKKCICILISKLYNIWQDIVFIYYNIVKAYWNCCGVTVCYNWIVVQIFAQQLTYKV